MTVSFIGFCMFCEIISNILSTLQNKKKNFLFFFFMLTLIIFTYCLLYTTKPVKAALTKLR